MVEADRVRELLNYDPITGIVTWRVLTGRSRVGSPAGYIRKDGYRQIKIDGRVYLAHRLVWLHMTGSWPARELDQRNLDKLDNRWENLRQATRSQNNANSRRPNKTGFRGVVQNYGRFVAQIALPDGQKRNLGRFDTPEEAHAAYMVAAREHFGEFARAE